MNKTIIVFAVLAAIVAAYVLIRNHIESKTDDVEKEIDRVMRKNRSAVEKSFGDKNFNPDEKLKNIYTRIKQRFEKGNKKLILSLIAMALVTILGFVTIFSAVDDDYSENEDYLFGGTVIPDGYNVAGYNVTGSKEIICIDGVLVSIEDFYEDRYIGENRGEPVIHFVIDNESSYDVSVSFDIVGVNGFCGESVSETIETFAGSGFLEDAAGYAFTGSDRTVKEIVFSHMTITNDNSGEYIYGGTDEEYEKVFRFSTDSDEEITDVPWDVKPIYDENDVKIYKSGTTLCIENNSEHDFGLTTYALPENQKTEDTICENLLLPYGYSVDFFLDGEYDTLDMDEGKVSFSFDFECKDSASADFKTGIIK